MNAGNSSALVTISATAEPKTVTSHGNAARAAVIAGVDADRRFLQAYSRIVHGYVETLLWEHTDPVDNHAIAAELSRAAADPLGTLKLHLEGKLDPLVAESVQAAIAESIDENCLLGEEITQIPQDVLSFMLTMQGAIEKEADRYRGPGNKRGPKKSIPIWVMVRDVIRLFEDIGARTSLPSNKNADDDSAVTPLLEFTEIVLQDAITTARKAVTEHRELKAGASTLILQAIRRDAAISRRTLITRLREYGRLRGGRSFSASPGEITAST